MKYMSNFDNNTNKYNDNPDDNFLDDLMKDFMDTEETQQAQVSQASEGIDKRAIEKSAEEPKETTRKRKPLFQTLGIEIEVDEKKTTKIAKQTSEPTSEVIDKIDIEDNNVQIIEKEKVDDVDKEVIVDDMFDNIFQEFTENIDDDKLDPDVIVPLEKPGMDEIKVTADGRTLAEMLPGMRSGNKSINEKMREITKQKSVVEIDGKKFSDNRYTKHIEVIEKEREEQEKRIALSKRFLQRNAKFSEEEKIIMKNLGVTNKEFTNLMKSTELSRKDKEVILGLGRYGAEKYFKGRRYRTTVGDQALLEFLVKFKFANTRILKWISNEPQGRTWRKLNRLRNSGLVESDIIIPDL